MNLLAILVAALVPLIVGFIWYNPKVFGNAWMKATGITDDKMKQSNMLLIFGVTFILSLLLAMAMQFMVIHQMHVTSLFFKQPIDDATTEMGTLYQSIMQKLGTSYRTFKHGALHGTISGFMVGLPIMGINALFERRGFKYIAINVGYWMLCMGLMGGIVSAWM